MFIALKSVAPWPYIAQILLGVIVYFIIAVALRAITRKEIGVFWNYLRRAGDLRVNT
jgi:hypothetical protein